MHDARILCENFKKVYRPPLPNLALAAALKKQSRDAEAFVASARSLATGGGAPILDRFGVKR